jgi:uroporphyrinogen decarboxylase
MNKIERVDNVLSGKEVDRPPISLWYHFGIQHTGGQQFARVTLEFFDYYDFDFLKVMNDYYYPAPEGLDSVSSKEDLQRFSRFDAETSIWKQQFRALEIINRELEGQAYFIDTVFDPWQSIRRSLAAENIKDLMAHEPDALLDALDIITENLIAYCRISLRLGASGIFLSVPAAGEFVTRDQFLKFVKPFTMRVFEAIAGLGRMNTAHIHGEDLFFEDVLDFPVDIYNWWDRGPNGPSLQSVKKKISGCVMGGIDHKIITTKSNAFLKNHVREGIKLGGSKRFFLANGCTINSWANPRTIQAITEMTGDR